MYFLYIYEYGTLTPVEIILRGIREKGEEWRDEPNWDTICTYMEMSHQIPLYNYNILIKAFLKK
jgi:hypothetical protein